MAKRDFTIGQTSQSMDIVIGDTSSIVGAGLPGLVFNTAGLTAYYRKGATGTPTAISLVTQTVTGAWTSGGFVEVDAVHMKGQYRFDIPDTILASAPYAIICFYGATNMQTNFSELAIGYEVVVKAQVVAALSTDNYAEPGQGQPASTTNLAAKISYLYKAARNLVKQTASEYDLYSNDDVTVDQKATVSDDGTTFTRNKIVSGP